METPKKTIEASTFKLRCLAFIDEVEATGQSLVITKDGTPLAKLVPVDSDSDKIYGFLQGKGEIPGDIISPAIQDW